MIGMLALAITAGLIVPTGAAAQSAFVTAPVAVPFHGEDASALAWECPSGDFCIWENTGGTGRRCNWSVADPDWQGGTIRCSWSGATKVESAFDNGNDTSFASVAAYRQANYGSRWGCFDRGVTYNVTAGGVLLRSHQWVTNHC
ncbi:MAG: peptidase inhibitor family I36 protein [Actinophytocola sp.]|uniref:peptidase inhibitor family I36 protein n=1 Tax=Actinophytocola sp. TaxID=1872138 RepID=UPI003C7445D9